jgi:hypothetical protein
MRFSTQPTKSRHNVNDYGDEFMNERPRSREGERKEHRGALSWLLQHWKISSLLGVEQSEPRRGLLQYWPLIVTLLTVAAVHATLEDYIKVLPPSCSSCWYWCC